MGTVVMKNWEPLVFGPEFCTIRGFSLLAMIEWGKGSFKRGVPSFCLGVDVRGGRTHSHAQQPGGIMLQLEVLVLEGLGSVDTSAAGAVAEDEVAALDHEVFDLMSCVLLAPTQTPAMWGVTESRGYELLRTTRWNLLPL